MRALNSEGLKAALLIMKQNTRDQRARHLKEWRRYKKMFGETDYITGFMKGMAEGAKPSLHRVDMLLQYAEAMSNE